MAFSTGGPAKIEAVELAKGDNLVVSAPAFLAAAASVQMDVALVVNVRDEGERRTLVMYRLTGQGSPR